MTSKSAFIVLVVLLAASCATQRNIRTPNTTDRGGTAGFCDSVKSYKALYINNIYAEISLGQETYNARVSIYYVPDSVILISALNSGFEIVRMGIMKDSTLLINRLDKVLYIYKYTEMGASPPVDFKDFEFLINRSKICSSLSKTLREREEYVVDRSMQGIRKEIRFSRNDYTLLKFQFFQKQTSEYIVGERTTEDQFLIYSNFLLEDVMLKTTGGSVEYDMEKTVNLSVNRDKYDIIYL